VHKSTIRYVVLDYTNDETTFYNNDNYLFRQSEEEPVASLARNMWYITTINGVSYEGTLKIEKDVEKKLAKLLRSTNLTSLFAKAWKYYPILIFIHDVNVADMTWYDCDDTNIVDLLRQNSWQMINISDSSTKVYGWYWYRCQDSNLALCLGAKFLAKVTMFALYLGAKFVAKVTMSKRSNAMETLKRVG